MIELHCLNCSTKFPEQGVPYRCEKCGGIWGISTLPVFDFSKLRSKSHTIWRYREYFPLPVDAPAISLGEGGTPLIWSSVEGKRVGFKLEYLNPTGSFKDRGTSVVTSYLLSKGVNRVIEDSSGNAGASLAAYASKAGIETRIYVPANASGPKRMQIESYGGEVIPIKGTRAKVADAVLMAASQGEIYASHAYLPHTISGFSTIAYELVEEIGKTPGTVIAPVGQGNLLLGIMTGFMHLLDSGVIHEMPKIVGVQALACAPIWAIFQYGAAGIGWVSEGETLAEGVRILRPVHGDEVLNLLHKFNGTIHAVEEYDIMPARDSLASLGFYVEPTSAIVWDAWQKLNRDLPEPVVLILSGSGYKATT